MKSSKMPSINTSYELKNNLLANQRGSKPAKKFGSKPANAHTSEETKKQTSKEANQQRSKLALDSNLISMFTSKKGFRITQKKRSQTIFERFLETALFLEQEKRSKSL